VDDIASVPISALLERLSDPDSALGAGSAAALVGALSAGILRAVARASADWPDGPGAAAQAEALMDRLAPLADDNARAYRRARAALAGDLPPDPQERRDFALGQVLERSAEVPARIGAAAADVAELAEGLAEHGLGAGRPDAGAAAVLAAAASEAAAQLVAVNLAERRDGPLVRAARESAARARRAAERAGAAALA
jgi:formiminotetrahydrofolate cyclodeaminase